MSYLDIFNQRNSAYGDSIRDIRVESTKTVITNSFTSSPSYYQVAITNAAISTSIIDVQIVDDSQTRDEKLLTTIYETLISMGNIITWKMEKWMIVHFDEMSEIYKRCKIRKCLSTLKWLDSNGEIQEVDFTYRSQAATNFGITDDRVLTLGNERRQLIIPSNTETLKIKKDKKFIFDERGWKVSAFDKMDDGVIYLTLEEDEINPAVDDMELRIADYVGKVANYTIQIMNGENFSIKAGTSLQLSVEVRNNGVIVDKMVSYESSNTSIASIDSSGLLTAIANGTLMITAKIVDRPTIIDITNVTVQLGTVDNFSISINDNPLITSGYSKTYTVIIKNNNVVVSGRQVQWYLTNTDNTTTPSIATMTFNSTTQCTIKGNGVGWVHLKVVLVGSVGVHSIIPIQIISLI